MRRAAAILAVVLSGGVPAVSVGESSSDAGTSGGEETAAEDVSVEEDGGAAPPETHAATQFAALVGGSWGGRRGCRGEWKGVWKVSGGAFSLVTGSTSDTSSAAFHAVCNSYRSIGPYSSPKVSITLLGGVIHSVAVLAGGGSAPQKSEVRRYFEAACDGSRSSGEGTRYTTVYESCGGFDVGLADGESDLSLYFFADESAFRSRMNSLPMPSKPDD